MNNLTMTLPELSGVRCITSGRSEFPFASLLFPANQDDAIVLRGTYIVQSMSF